MASKVSQIVSLVKLVFSNFSLHARLLHYQSKCTSILERNSCARWRVWREGRREKRQQEEEEQQHGNNDTPKKNKRHHNLESAKKSLRSAINQKGIHFLASIQLSLFAQSICAFNVNASVRKQRQMSTSSSNNKKKQIRPW